MMQARLVLFLAVAAVAKGVPPQPLGRLNQTEADGGLEAKERYRRLIPYMTFYVGGGNRLNGGAFLRSGQADYRPIVAVAGPADNLIPYLPHQGSPYLQPSALTRMITQNYLAIAKQQIPQTNRYYQQQRPKYYTRGYVRPTEGGSYSRPAAQEPVYQRPQQTSYQRPAEDTSYQKPAEEVQAYQRPAEEVTAYKRPAEEVPTYQRPAEPAVVYQRPLEAYQRPTYQNYHIPEGPRYVARPTNGVAFSAKPSDTSVTITQSQEISVPDTTALPLPQTQIYQAPNQYYKVEKEKEINSVLDRVELSKALPEKITTDNLGSSIKTLSKLLRLLQEAHDAGGELANTANKLAAKIPPSSQEGSTPGRAGIDYPAYTEIPTTRFSCKLQRYKGFFGDPETGCQVWHYCDLNGGQASFLCPNGTIFSQVALTCDWWFNVKCDTTAQLYVLNERLYKYILPHKPSFPEDYAGPLVDSYLRLKFDQIQSNSTAANARQTPDQIDEQEEEEEEEEEPQEIEELQEEDE